MVYNKTDPDDALDFWIDTFVTIYDKHAPYKHKRVKSFPKPKWFSKEPQEARFQGPASSCSRWPIASFMVYGFTNPVRLHAVYPCILGLSVQYTQYIMVLLTANYGKSITKKEPFLYDTV